MKQTSRWNEAKSRIQANENALAEAFAPSPARIEAAFHQRALRLAQRHIQDKSASRGLPALVFRLSRERHAIELKELAEVLPFRGCTQIPGTSPKFLGVINLRGELRPVIDLGMVLCGTLCGDSGFILVLRRRIGLKVDDIQELREIHPEKLAAPVPGHCTRALLSETLKLLDVESMLSDVFSPKESRSI
jgi:chemotaxis signal transduction protein